MPLLKVADGRYEPIAYWGSVHEVSSEDGNLSFRAIRAEVTLDAAAYAEQFRLDPAALAGE